MALQALDAMRQQQSSELAFLDAFWLFAVTALALMPLCFLMRKSVAEEGCISEPNEALASVGRPSRNKVNLV